VLCSIVDAGFVNMNFIPVFDGLLNESDASKGSAITGRSEANAY